MEISNNHYSFSGNNDVSRSGAEEKIEQSGIGDPMRGLGTQKGGISALFANCNRGKKSIDLDLKNSECLNIAK